MSIDQGYDGDGQAGWRVEDHPSLVTPVTTYYVRSTVLHGQVVADVITTAFRAGTHNTHIYVNGSELAYYDSWGKRAEVRTKIPYRALTVTVADAPGREKRTAITRGGYVDATRK